MTSDYNVAYPKSVELEHIDREIRGQKNYDLYRVRKSLYVTMFVNVYVSVVHLFFRGHALPLLCRLLHCLAKRLGILNHGFELQVRKHPEEVIQDQNQLGGHHVAILNLHQVQLVGINMHYIQAKVALEHQLM